MRPLILITNDDGIGAPGIRALVEAARELGDILVVAPDSPQSGQGHAITLEHPLRLYKVEVFEGVESYECSGTPVDCVKLAKHVLTKDREINLCLSGINHGANSSINIIYSGTMSAAMEASIEKIPSIGFSLLNYKMDADFTAAKHFVKEIASKVLDNGLKETRLLNVNIPNLPLSEIKGVKVCRQAEGHWAEEFIHNVDPSGRPYYWLSGYFNCEDEGTDTDIWALENGYVSVVPSMHDLTAHPAIKELNYLNK
jgi:5'-nucleotidase